MTIEDFRCRGQPNLDSNFLTVTFRAELLSLIVLPLFRLQCNNFTCPIIHRSLRLPCKTNHDILGIGQVDFSFDLLISLKVPKSNRSEDPFFFRVHFLLLHVGNSYPAPFLLVYVVYMRVYIVQQFTVYIVQQFTVYIVQQFTVYIVQQFTVYIVQQFTVYIVQQFTVYIVQQFTVYIVQQFTVYIVQQFTVYIVQQFTVFTENVEKVNLYICEKLFFISCPIQMLLSCAKLYHIRRSSG